MTAPALVKEADMIRAIRAAKKLGAARVSISKDGTIVFDIEHPIANKAIDYFPPDEPLVHIRRRPAKKVTL